VLLLLIGSAGGISVAEALISPCRGVGACAAAWGALSWAAAIFPNAFWFPLVFTGAPTIALVLLMTALNALFAAAVWRWLPRRLGPTILALVLTGWAALSVITTWYAPELAKPAYQALR